MRFFEKITLLILGLGLFACADERGIPLNDGTPQDPESASYDLEVDEPESLPAEKKEIYQLIQEGKDLSYDQLTLAFLGQHVSAYNEGLKNKSEKEWSGDESPVDLKEVQKRIQKLASGLSKKDWHQLKVDYEKRLGEISIDAGATNVVDVLQTKSLQAYSGTSLQILIWRELLSAKDFADSHFVVIFEDGHLLPGYMREESGEWNLYGIEMTTSGPSKVVYGPTSKLNLPIRVIEAQAFLVSEIFKNDLSDPESLRAQAVDKAASKFQIPASHMEEQLKTLMAVGPRGKEKEKKDFVPGQSLFCFGHPMIGQGKRNSLDEIRAGLPRNANANTGRYQSRVMVDHQVDISAGCGLEGKITAEDVPEWIWKHLAKSFPGDIEDIKSSSELQVEDCLLFLSDTEFDTQVSHRDSSLGLAIYDLSLKEEILAPSIISIYSSIDLGSEVRSLMLVDSKIRADRDPDGADELLVFSWANRAIVGELKGVAYFVVKSAWNSAESRDERRSLLESFSEPDGQRLQDLKGTEVILMLQEKRDVVQILDAKTLKIVDELSFLEP